MLRSPKRFFLNPLGYSETGNQAFSKFIDRYCVFPTKRA